jgi:hypothetical protein
MRNRQTEIRSSTRRREPVTPSSISPRWCRPQSRAHPSQKAAIIAFARHGDGASVTARASTIAALTVFAFGHL